MSLKRSLFIISPLSEAVLMTLEQFIALSSIGGVVFIFLVICLRGVCYIPQDKIGIVEKFWSTRGSLREGRIIALNREAGFQADILRGGIHFGYQGSFWRNWTPNRLGARIRSFGRSTGYFGPI